MCQASEQQLRIKEFDHPFGCSLDDENRWVKLSRLIPWPEVEQLYADSFPKSGRGRRAFNVRVALGLLIIIERQGYFDKELVESIRENPYLQFFIGFRSYRNKRPFDPSLLVTFRKRLDPLMTRINELIALPNTRAMEKTADPQRDDDDPPSDGDKSAHHGKLLLDPTCAPADVTYPTDLKLVNTAREKTEQIIDLLHAPLRGEMKKPRTYRRKARKAFLAFVRKKGRKLLKSARQRKSS